MDNIDINGRLQFSFPCFHFLLQYFIKNEFQRLFGKLLGALISLRWEPFAHQAREALPRIHVSEDTADWNSRTVKHHAQCSCLQGRLRLKCDGTRAETRFRLSAKRTNPFKSAGASVQSTTGSRVVRISSSNAGFTMFRGSVKSKDYPLHSPVSPSLPLPCITVCHHISTGVYGVLVRWIVRYLTTNNRTLFFRNRVHSDKTWEWVWLLCTALYKNIVKLIIKNVCVRSLWINKWDNSAFILWAF